MLQSKANKSKLVDELSGPGTICVRNTLELGHCHDTGSQPEMPPQVLPNSLS